MRLYVNSNNQWFGNQDDANAAKSPYELCVVPDDKKGLITFLNNFKASTEVDAPEDIVLLPWKEERNQKISDDQMASIGVAIHNKNHSAHAKGISKTSAAIYLNYDHERNEITDVQFIPTIRNERKES